MDSVPHDESFTFSEIFYRKEGKESIEVLFKLNPASSQLAISDPSMKIELPLKYIIGATVEEKSLSFGQTESHEFLLQISMLNRNPIQSKFPFQKSDNRILQHVYFTKDKKIACDWKNLIIHAANNPHFCEASKNYNTPSDLPPFKRNLLVFVNPKSGKGNGPEIWKNARQILEKAGCEFTEVLTEYHGHAKDYIEKAESVSLKKFDGILTVSGDGLPHEVVNGIMSRPDWEEMRHIPIGPLPGGSGNAIVACLLNRAKLAYNLENACYLVAKGSTIKADLTRVEIADKPPVYSFLMFIWGILSYVDFESEKCRFLGGLRFDIYAALAIMKNIKCRAKIMFSTTSTDLPPLDEELSEDTWQTIQDEFSYFSIHNLPFMVAGAKAAPLADFDDGHNHFLALRGENCTRAKLIKTWNCLNEELFEGERPKAETGLMFEKIKSFRLEPLEGNYDYSIDGERYPVGKAQGRVMEKVITYFCDA